MFDNSEKVNSSTHVRKQRACDQCRKRKVRCTGRDAGEETCTSCSTSGLQCTYTNFKRHNIHSRKITLEYVEELERTVEKLKSLLNSIESSPIPDASPPSSPPPIPLAQTKDIFSQVLRNMNDASTGSTSPAWSDDDDDIYVPIRGREGEGFVLGMSSSTHLAKEVMKMKMTDTGDFSNALSTMEPEVWQPDPSFDELIGPTIFPDDLTLERLVSTYFEYVNIFWPCLHRPTLERQIAEGVHLNDIMVEIKVLLVIAIGAQYTPEYKLYWNSAHPEESLAWKWFRRSHALRKNMPFSLPVVSLDEYQISCLGLQFLLSHQNGHAGWLVCGVGLRIIQCSGAHKRSRYVQSPPLEGEFTKRVVWIHAIIDTFDSAAFGSHPIHLLSDLGPLIECDDEYCFEGDSVEECFRQPPDKPTRIAFLNRLIPLMRILQVLLQTIYSARHLKAHMGINISEFNMHLVRELDSAMNAWMEAMPAHLKWDPKREDYAFFSQSAMLHCCFYFVQILIHQPFITSPAKFTSSDALPSMSICLNAARACCRVAEAHMNRTGFSTITFGLPVFTSGLILLTSIYRKTKSGVSVDVEHEIADVRRCSAIIESSSDRWKSSARMSLILKELTPVTPNAEAAQTTGFSQKSQTGDGMGGLDVDALLSQSWDDLSGGWDLFTGLDGTNSSNLRDGLGAFSAQMGDGNPAPAIPVETLWPNVYMQPMDGMGDMFPSFTEATNDTFGGVSSTL